MRKVKIHNSYEKWDWTDKTSMSDLKSKREAWFVISNLLWSELFIFIVFHNWFVSLLSIIPIFSFLMWLVDDIEYI